MMRPRFMRIDGARCLACDLCYDLAPVISQDPQSIPVTTDTLDAMAACPTGAIVWLEERERLNMEKLDVRTIAPRERHPMIFGLFDALEPNEAFELVNDHDPKPLYYQFQAEREGQVAWEYLESGPETWRVRIGRV